MKKTKITVNLIFPKTLLIFRYMEFDWSKVQTLDDAINFYHKWHNDMLTSKNEFRIDAIKSIVYPLYSMLTGTSYESKLKTV